LKTRPGAGALPDYYLGYIEGIPAEVDEVLPALRAQFREVVALTGGLSEERQRFSYAPGKWTVREVVGHLLDTERVFQLRALWFARGAESPQPGFDEKRWGEVSRVGDLPMGALLEEYSAVRESSVLLFRNLDPEALERTGEANGRTFQVGALAWFLLAHEAHHLAILKERYDL
jgi:hypothetical protein